MALVSFPCMARLTPPQLTKARRPRPQTSCSQSPRPQPGQAVDRRALLVGTSFWAAVSLVPGADAVQGLTAGRIPGLGPLLADGTRLYTRPEGKSGGHGVGWSTIPPYSFSVPDGWAEVPTSIADLGGAEVDLRFKPGENATTGAGCGVSVVVAPVLRFANVGFQADVRIEDLVSLERLIKAFGPEVAGETVDDDNITSMEVVTNDDGLKYYLYELKELSRTSHLLVSATAFKNRLYLLAVQASALGWRKSAPALKKIQKSFRVSTQA